MKTPFRYLTFIGTALIVATGSSAAFAQSSPYSNSYDSVCGYTPQNRYCVGTNYSDRMMNSADIMMNNSDGMVQPNTNNSSQTNQPLNSSENSRPAGTYQQSMPSQSSDRTNFPSSTENQDRTNSSGSLGNQAPERTNTPGSTGTGNQDPRVISPGSMNNENSMPQR